MKSMYSCEYSLNVALFENWLCLLVDFLVTLSFWLLTSLDLGSMTASCFKTSLRALIVSLLISMCSVIGLHFSDGVCLFERCYVISVFIFNIGEKKKL